MGRARHVFVRQALGAGPLRLALAGGCTTLSIARFFLLPAHHWVLSQPPRPAMPLLVLEGLLPVPELFLKCLVCRPNQHKSPCGEDALDRAPATGLVRSNQGRTLLSPPATRGKLDFASAVNCPAKANWRRLLPAWQRRSAPLPRHAPPLYAPRPLRSRESAPPRRRTTYKVVAPTLPDPPRRPARTAG